MKNKFIKSLPLVLFVFSIGLFSLFYGMAAQKFELFPNSQLQLAWLALKQVSYQTPFFKHWYYKNSDQNSVLPTFDKNKTQIGLTKLVMLDKNKRLAVKIVDLDGTIVHQWPIDWFEIWPKPTHLEHNEIPWLPPGPHIHGAEILDNGDLLFNFEHRGLVRLNACGDVVWKLPYRTHHSIYKGEDGNFWVSGQINHNEPLDRIPHAKPPFVEDTILQVSPSGQILQEQSVLELLKKNGLNGLIYNPSTNDFKKQITGDTTHLNDVELFPTTLGKGFFSPGDIMISLRNPHAILVFDPDWKIKFSSIGHFVGQHDPDFLDGDHISIFDNNNIGRPDQKHQSRIIIQSAITGKIDVVYTGSKEHPFFTQYMGKHQWLRNGNLLVADSLNGRAFEVTPSGDVVWEYVNIVEEGLFGLLTGAERLPAAYGREFFERTSQACSK